MSDFFPLISFNEITLGQANMKLLDWAHKMGPLRRGNQAAVCHGLFHGQDLIAVTTASTLIAPVCGGGLSHLTRENSIELSRLCAGRAGICRVALRLWREFVFPALGYQNSLSYQDSDLHNGATYRFDGWKREGRSRSGTDTRSGRPGRDKWIWVWTLPHTAVNSQSGAVPALDGISVDGNSGL